MSTLSDIGRGKLPSSAFGIPGERKYPMPDRSHAANAKARAKQMLNGGHISRPEYARIVAKAVNCPNAIDGEPDDTCPSCVAIRDGRALDVVELDAASNNRVDDMRELLPCVYTAAADLKRKVFIIDAVQRIK